MILSRNVSHLSMRFDRFVDKIQFQYQQNSHHNVNGGSPRGFEPASLIVSELFIWSRWAIPYFIKVMLLDLVCPMMTCLVHHRAHFPRFLVLSIIENVSHSHLHVCLQ